MANIIDALKKQRTFVMLKPDAVHRWLIGRIIQRFEDKELQFVAMKLIQATAAQVRKHYPVEDTAWVTRLGVKSTGTFTEAGINVADFLGTTDEFTIGQRVLQYLVDFITSGPVLLIAVQWPHAVDMVRKMVGETLPARAMIGTIRGDFSVDTPLIANVEGRSMRNLIHASETPEEAEKEIALWFDKGEILAV